MFVCSLARARYRECSTVAVGGKEGRKGWSTLGRVGTREGRRARERSVVHLLCVRVSNCRHGGAAIPRLSVRPIVTNGGGRRKEAFHSFNRNFGADRVSRNGQT